MIRMFLVALFIALIFAFNDTAHDSKASSKNGGWFFGQYSSKRAPVSLNRNKGKPYKNPKKVRDSGSK